MDRYILAEALRWWVDKLTEIKMTSFLRSCSSFTFLDGTATWLDSSGDSAARGLSRLLWRLSQPSPARLLAHCRSLWSPHVSLTRMTWLRWAAAVSLDFVCLFFVYCLIRSYCLASQAILLRSVLYWKTCSITDSTKSVFILSFFFPPFPLSSIGLYTWCMFCYL